jgi:methionyl-tRNA formyltransferase
LYRAFAKWPGAFFKQKSTLVYLRKMELVKEWDQISKKILVKIDSGKLFALRNRLNKKTDLLLKTNDGALKVDQIQVEGKKVVSADSYICGCHDLEKVEI